MSGMELLGIGENSDWAESALNGRACSAYVPSHALMLSYTMAISSGGGTAAVEDPDPQHGDSAGLRIG